MFTLFENESGVSRGKFTNVKYNYYLNKQSDSIDERVAHYRVNYKRVSGVNVLVRLLYLMDWNIEIGAAGYYTNALEKVDDYATAVKMVSTFNRGGIIKNNTLDKTEVIMLNINSHDISFINQHWPDLQPLKVLSRPGVKGSLLRPDLQEYDEGYLVYGINIPMLAVMYYHWSVMNSERPSNERETIMHFLGRYVLPNTMYSQMDIIQFSILNQYDLLPTYEFETFPSETQVIDYTGELIQELIVLLEKYQRNPTTPEQLLMGVEMVTGGTIGDKLPEVGKLSVTANYWAQIMVYLPIVNGLLELTPNATNKRETKNDIDRLMRKIKSYRALVNAPDNDLKIYINDMMETFQGHYSSL